VKIHGGIGDTAVQSLRIYYETNVCAKEPTNPLENVISRMRALRITNPIPHTKNPGDASNHGRTDHSHRQYLLSFTRTAQPLSNSTNPAKHDFNRHLALLSGTQQSQLRLTALASQIDRWSRSKYLAAGLGRTIANGGRRGKT
jgi:hypothetical protein